MINNTDAGEAHYTRQPEVGVLAMAYGTPANSQEDEPLNPSETNTIGSLACQIREPQLSSHSGGDQRSDDGER